tara:strand:+ start:181 stop:813 length:633 start_codon:yes stop_codon:yes gene_type:complete
MIYAVQNYHYSKTRPAGAIFGYNVFNKKNEWCGVIMYGRGGCSTMGDAYNLKHGQIIELVRMALNGKQESTSKALSISLKLIKKDCPTVKMIVSYADKGQNHIGTIYQATNWYYVGQTKSSGYEYWYKGKWTHSKTISNAKKQKGLRVNLLKKRKVSGKIKYLYPIDKKMLNKLNVISKEYPKKLCDNGVIRSTLSYQDKGEGAVPILSL